jgi:acyl-homoserine lactone acylase PvdQ
VTRAESWAEACRIARKAIDELIKLQSDYEKWRDTLPADPSTAQLLEEIYDLDFNTAIEIIEKAEELTLPKGFGRD